MAKDFCKACGASIPSRFGEGTCIRCDPVGVAKHEEALKAKSKRH